jgi:1-acyl-sn-glycerol-3-phosphate acyltransferase
MSLLASFRVLGAMARVTAPTVIEALRGQLERGTVDERTRWFGRRVVELLGVDLQVTGAARVPTDRAVVYLSNHQSHMDVPMLYASLPSSTIRMLAKAELFEIPVWGRALGAAEFIEVHRGEHARGVEAIERAKRLMGEGVSIWIAPEGTRSRDGSIGKLKKGGFHLALSTGAPIVPVAISGTLAILPPGGKAMVTGRHVEVAIGAPIEVAGRDVAGLVDEVRTYFVEHVH